MVFGRDDSREKSGVRVGGVRVPNLDGSCTGFPSLLRFKPLLSDITANCILAKRAKGGANCTTLSQFQANLQAELLLETATIEMEPTRPGKRKPTPTSIYWLRTSCM